MDYQKTWHHALLGKKKSVICFALISLRSNCHKCHPYEILPYPIWLTKIKCQCKDTELSRISDISVAIPIPVNGV